MKIYRVHYDIGLYKVERPTQARERYGESKITKVQEKGVEKYYFEDGMVKIVWIPTPEQILFILTNNTDRSIKIVWDEAAYVDENGVSHRVMHEGVKYIFRNNPQPPTVVVRKGTITDFIFPTDKVYFYNGWSEDPLFPTYIVEVHKGRVEQYVGKTIQVLLPIQIESVVNEYIFSFKINQVEVK